MSDDLFIKTELSTPEQLDRAAHNERPIATLTVQTNPVKRSRCFWNVLGVIVFGPFVLWLIDWR
jgi:hypothetical protein